MNAQIKQKLLDAANLLVRTNDPATTLTACVSVIDALGTIMSELTSQVVRVRMTAEGQPDALDMLKFPAFAGLLSKAARDVLAERQRQIDVKGWTPEHDDEHTHGELVQAAADLCLYGTNFRVVDPDGHQMIGWGLTERHRDDRRRQLVIADALILAEIERFDRAELNDEVQS